MRIALPRTAGFLKTDTWAALAIGTGMAIFPMHNPNQPLIQYLFLPYVGGVLIFYGCYDYLDKVGYKVNFGPKWVSIPMAVILATMVARLAVYPSFQTVSDLFLIMVFCALYLVSRKLSTEVFKVLIPFIILSSIGVIVSAILNPGQPTGGLVFYKNYDILTGYLILGFFLTKSKWTLYLLPLVSVALFLSGSSEAVFALFILGIFLLIRRDWSSKLVYALIPVVILGLAWLGLGYGEQLYLRGAQTLQEATSLNVVPSNQPSNVGVFADRVDKLKGAFQRLSILGNGNVLLNFRQHDVVHNVPLVIVDEIGPLAGLAWLIVTVGCFWKTKWKYAWLAIISLSVFDHFVFDQMAPYWWALAGVSTSVNIKSDFIFRRN